MDPVPLSNEQRDFIRLHYLNRSVAEIASQLNCEPQHVMAIIDELNLLVPPTEPVEKPVLYRIHLHTFVKKDFLWGLPAFLIPLYIYTQTMCHTLYPGDSGEYFSAGATLGFPQPAGYALWVLILKIGMFLFHPFFEHASVSGYLMNTIISSLTVYLLYLILLKLTFSRIISLVGSLLFAFSYQFWTLALVVESMNVHIFLTTACVLLILLWSEHQEQRFF